MLTPPLQEAVALRSSDEVLDVAIPARQPEPVAEAANATEAAVSDGRARRTRPNLTPEQLQKLQERMANMSEEEKAAYRQRRANTAPAAGERAQAAQAAEQ